MYRQQHAVPRPLESEDVRNHLALVIDQIKRSSFVQGYEATDEEAVGMMLSKYFGWDGLAILKASGYALEDSNFHTENAQVQEMIEKIK
jgi:hypothetical protein